MNDIEFLVGFLGLLFGLVLANVTNNLADAWRARRELPLGMAPLLVSTFIILSIGDQWMSVANNRDALQMDARNLFTVLGICLPYIFVSRALFPQKLEQWGSLEEFYIAERHEFLGVLMIPPIASVLSNLIAGTLPPDELLSFAIVKGPILLGPLLLMFTARVRIHRVVLVALCVHEIIMILGRSGVFG